jgi:hypothetical protein
MIEGKKGLELMICDKMIVFTLVCVSKFCCNVVTHNPGQGEYGQSDLGSHQNGSIVWFRGTFLNA